MEWLRQGFSKGTCSPVLSRDSNCLLQVTLRGSHWNCYTSWIRVDCYRICIAFFSGKRMRFHCGKKLACTRDGLRKRRGMLLELHAPWNWGLQVTFSCFVDAVLLCFACVETLRWNWRIKAMCSTVVCCNSIVLCVSVCADRSGMAASRFLAAAAACGIFFFCSWKS